MNEGSGSLEVDITEPLADVHVMQKLAAGAGGDMRAVRAEAALWAMRLVSRISDCSRLTSYLVQLLRHPNAQVRSKATLLLGRANLNLNRVRDFLDASDSRLRANAVESMWGHGQHKVVEMLWEATRDRNGRVMINALLGLCKAGEREALARLEALAGSPDPVLRAGAAWGMGETAATEFAPVLSMLEQDVNEKVRVMASRSKRKLGLA